MPKIIRGISILGFAAAIIIAVLSFFPDKKEAAGSYYDPESSQYSTLVHTEYNPWSWQLALGTAIASILTFGFASIVQASEYYISTFSDTDASQNENQEN
ncbi:MAG: hypothetical protein ACI4AK_01540 [Lepagella sp.]